jgi:hypothetical protein
MRLGWLHAIFIPSILYSSGARSAVGNFSFDVPRQKPRMCPLEDLMKVVSLAYYVGDICLMTFAISPR